MMLSFQLPTPIPSIPEGISNEGLLAVLFMVLLGVVAVIYGLSKGYVRIGPSESNYITAMHDLVSSNKEVISSNHEVVKELENVRRNLHTIIAPSVAGLAVSYLILAKEPKLAARLKKDIEDAGGEVKMP